MPKPSAESDCKQPYFSSYPHVFEERLEVKGLSHGELILNEACLPARYANITLLSVWVNSIENR